MKIVSILKIVLISALILLGVINVSAKSDDKTVTIVVSGQGKTQDEAKQNILRSAIEQAYGVYISSKTTIVNDKLLMDEITTLSNGAIKSYEILGKTLISNGEIALTMRVLVTPSIMYEIVKNKGYEVEFSGSNFLSTINQQNLNESAEIKIMSNLFLTSKKYLQNLYSYRIQTSEPKTIYYRKDNYDGISLDGDFEQKSFNETLSPYLDQTQNNYYLKREFANSLKDKLNIEFNSKDKEYYYQVISVNAFPNDNFINYINFLFLSLKNVTMNENSIKDYFRVGKRIYPFVLLDINGNRHDFYLRNEEAARIFYEIIDHMENNKKQFTINNGYKNLKMISNFEQIANRFYKNDNENEAFFVSDQKELNNNKPLFKFINFKDIEKNIAIADFVLIDVYSKTNLNRISKFTVTDGLLYSGKVKSARQYQNQKLSQEQTKQNGLALVNYILGFGLLFSLIYLPTLLK